MYVTANKAGKQNKQQHKLFYLTRQENSEC